MNIRTSAFRGLAILSLSVLGLAACDEKTVIEQDRTVVVTVSPENIDLQVGGTGTFIAVVSNSTNTAVNWTSSNTAVATVSNTGVVTAVAPGTATITAASAADANARDAGLVRVTAAPITLVLAPATATTAVGGTVQLVGQVSGTTNTAINYTSSTPTVATVNATTGLVTAVGAGTTIITARSAANPNIFQTATITVTPIQQPTVTLSPQNPSIGVGGTQQFVATVNGSTNTAVTYRSSNPAVATVTNAGLATGISQGTTVITAVSVADTTARANSTLTVVGASVAIASTAGGPAGVFTVNTNVSVPAGTADSLMIRLTNTANPALVYTVRCQTFTAAGAATTVSCPINPADLDPNTAGAQILPNGSYTIQAILMRQNNVAATASFAAPFVTNNQNTVFGTVTFDNTLNDVDNDPANAAVTTGGLIWNGGSATVTLTPSVFAGNAVTAVDIRVDEGCDGVTAGEAVRAVTIGANGTGSFVFSEANNRGAATPGIDDLVNANVCFRLEGARDAQGLTVGLAGTNAAQGQLFAAGSTPVASGTTQNTFSIDNVEPAAFTSALPAAVAANNNYAGTTTVFNQAAVVTVAAADAPGVGGVTYRFYAVPSGNLVAAPSQAQYAASLTSTGAVEVSSASQLPESTVANNAYTLVVEAKDALGNVRYNEAGDFGVDLTLPTIALSGTVASAANNSTNPTTELNFDITDTFSGPREVTARITVHSVLEVDADAGTEVQCIAASGAAPSAMPAGGVCPLFAVPVTDVLNSTTETAQVLVPDAPAVEGYMVIEVQSVDRAGNFSSTTISRTVLADVTAPTGTIDQYTVITSNNSISVNGTINENVDLASYDVRYNFPGLATIPTQIPFTSPVTVDTYGLPLTGVFTVTGQNAVNIREVREGATTATPNQVGFGARDVAGNFGFINQGIAFGGGGNGTGLTASDVGGMSTLNFEATATMDRSAATAGTLRAIVQVGATDANPISRVYFYYVQNGALVLIGSTTDAAVITGQTERTYTFQLPMSPSLIAANGTYNFVALAVDSQGDALVSDVEAVVFQD